MGKEISFVIVEYHCINEIVSCVSAIDANVSEPHEIIVSSNSCYSDEEKAKIPFISENVSWAFNRKNGGFAYAINQGMKQTVGAYIVIMNSDCTLLGPLSPMISFLKANPGVGAIAPQLVDDAGNIQDSARPYVTPRRFIIRQTRRLLSKKRLSSILNKHFDYGKVQTVDWVIGAFIMVTRHAYELTNGLDGNMFMYAEDAEWCTRIRKYGLEVVYFPLVRITYKGTRRARSNKKYAHIFLSSHLYYWRKVGFFFGYPNRKKKVWNLTLADFQK